MNSSSNKPYTTQIRAAKTSDLSVVASIYNHFLGIATMDMEKQHPDDYAGYIDANNKKEELWILEDNDQILAWGLIKKYSNRYGYRFTCETSVYCHHEHCGRGFGSELKTHLINRCKDLGYKHLVAKIGSDNEVSIKYNLKMGYSIVGTQKRIGEINGEWKDVTIMQLLLV